MSIPVVTTRLSTTLETHLFNTLSIVNFSDDLLASWANGRVHNDPICEKKSNEESVKLPTPGA